LEAVQTAANNLRIDKSNPTVDAGTDQTKNAEFTQTGLVDADVA
jgi:hypothetical protein